MAFPQSAPLRPPVYNTAAFGVQTQTHVVEARLDHGYEWNAWALRRQALSLANLPTKLTRSAQTSERTFRRHCATQFWQPRPAVTQTAYNKGQRMARQLRFVTGIRGGGESQPMRVLQLELDLGQPHEL